MGWKDAPIVQPAGNWREAPLATQDLGMTRGMARTATDGLLFGAGDEYFAGLYSVLGRDPASGGWFNYDRPISERYQDALGQVRAEEKQFRTDHAVAATVGEIGGGLVTAALPVGIAARGAGLGVQALRGAAAGAAMGGLYGYNEGEGSIGGRVENGIYGAGGGAVFGGLIPIAGRGIGAAWKGGKQALASRAVGREIGEQLGISPTAGRLLARSASMDDPRLMRAAIQDAGADAMLADAGPTLQGALDSAIQAPGEGARTANMRITDRATRAGARIADALDNTMGKPEGVTTAIKDIRSSTAGARKSAYDAAYANEIDWRSPAGARLRGILETTPDDALLEAARLKAMTMREAPRIPDAAFPEYAPTVTQRPGSVVAAQEAAERADVDAFFAAYNQPAATGMKRPLTDKIKKMGGIDPKSPAAAELYHLGVTPRTTPGLFRRGGLKDLDNIAVSEVADTLRTSGADDTGNYISRDAIFQALRGELDGNAVRDAADAIDPRAAAEMDRLLPEYEARRAALEGEPMPPDPGPVSDIVPMKTVEDVDLIARALGDVARKERNIRDAPTGYGIKAEERGRALRDALAEVAPGYDDAVSLGKDTIRRTEAVEFGAKLLSPATTRTDALARIAKMTPAEKAAAKQGVRSQIDDVLGRVKAVASDPNVDVRETSKAFSELSSRNTKAKLQALLGNDWQTIEDELSQASWALGLRARTAANSRTAQRGVFDTMLDADAAPGAFASGEWIDGWSTLTAPAKGVFQTIARTTPEAVQKAKASIRSELADALTRPQAAKALDAIEAIAAKREVPKEAGRALAKALEKGAFAYLGRATQEISNPLLRGLSGQ